MVQYGTKLTVASSTSVLKVTMILTNAFLDEFTSLIEHYLTRSHLMCFSYRWGGGAEFIVARNKSSEL